MAPRNTSFPFPKAIFERFVKENNGGSFTSRTVPATLCSFGALCRCLVQTMGWNQSTANMSHQWCGTMLSVPLTPTGLSCFGKHEVSVLRQSGISE